MLYSENRSVKFSPPPMLKIFWSNMKVKVLITQSCPRVGTHSLLQGLFLTQGSNMGLPHFGQILDCLSHKGSPFGT